MSRVTAVAYNQERKIEFMKAFNFYHDLLKGINVKIEPVRSTSIEELWGKPILDIDIVHSSSESNEVIDKLSSVGYVHIGNYGIEALIRIITINKKDNGELKYDSAKKLQTMRNSKI